MGDQGAASTRLRAVSWFDLEARFFVPTQGSPPAARADVVKDGRRAGGAAASCVARPRLDGGEHGATLGLVGMAGLPSPSKRAMQPGPWKMASRPSGYWCTRTRALT